MSALHILIFVDIFKAYMTVHYLTGGINKILENFNI